MKYSRLCLGLYKFILDRKYNVQNKYKLEIYTIEKDLPYGISYPATPTEPILVQLYLNKSMPYMNYLTYSHELAHVYSFLYDSNMNRYIHAIDVTSKYYYQEYHEKIPYDEALSAIAFIKIYWCKDKLPYFDLNKVREICQKYKI